MTRSRESGCLRIRLPIARFMPTVITQKKRAISTSPANISSSTRNGPDPRTEFSYRCPRRIVYPLRGQRFSVLCRNISCRGVAPSGICRRAVVVRCSAAGNAIKRFAFSPGNITFAADWFRRAPFGACGLKGNRVQIPNSPAAVKLRQPSGCLNHWSPATGKVPERGVSQKTCHRYFVLTGPVDRTVEMAI